MKNIIATGLFLLAQCAAFAQQSVLNGTVTVFNSQFETGKKQYVANAQVEEDYGKSQATTTNTEGSFKLPLVGIKDLDKVFFNVKKATYEVVNTDALQAAAGQKEAVQVYMAQEGVLAENKRTYYQINRTASEKAVTEKLVQLGQQIETLQQNKEANRAKIEALQAEYARLQESFKKIDETARELAERYAKTNLDDASADYQRAFRYFQRGLLDSALLVFQKMDLEQTAQLVVREQNRTAALKTEYETRNTEKNKQKVQTTEALLFKADLHQTKFEFDKTEQTFELLIRLDTSSYENNYDFGAFLVQQKKYDKALVYLNAALNWTDSDFKKAQVFNIIGICYFDTNFSMKADSIYKIVLGIRRQLVQTKPVYLPNLAAVLINLGSNDILSQKMKAGESYLLEGLSIQQKLVQNGSYEVLPDLANTYNSLGIFYDRNLNIKAAETNYLEAIRIYRQLRAKDSSHYRFNLANALVNLSGFYLDHNTNHAEKFSTEALFVTQQIAKENFEAYAPLLCSAFNNLAVSKATIQKAEEAKELHLESIQISEKWANKNPQVYLPLLARSYFSLGTLFQEIEQLDSSELYLIKSLKIRKELVKQDANIFLPSVALTLQNLGRAYFYNHKMKEAEQAWYEAVQIYKQLVIGTGNTFLIELGDCLNNLAECYANDNKILESLETYKEALPYYTKAYELKPESYRQQLSLVLFNIGILSTNLSKVDSSITYFGEALNLLYEPMAKKDSAFIGTFSSMTLLLEQLSDTLAIEKEIKNATAILKILAISYDSVNQFSNSYIVKTLDNYKKIAWFYILLRNYQEVEKIVLKGFEISPNEKSLLQFLGHSQLLRGKYSEAKASYEKLKGKKDSEGKDYKQALLNDFKALEAEGITHKDMPRMKAEIEKW